MSFESFDNQLEAETIEGNPRDLGDDIEILDESADPALDASIEESIDALLNSDNEDTSAESGEQMEHDPTLATIIKEIKTQQVIEQKERSLQLIELIMQKMGFTADGTESNLMAEFDENSNVTEVPHQNVKTIVTKHLYGDTAEVKLVKMSPLGQQDLEKEGLNDIGIEPNKEMYLVYVKNKEAAQSDANTDFGYSIDQSKRIAT